MSKKRASRVRLHGAFGSRTVATRKARQVRGGTVKPVKVRGGRRYVVMSRRKG